MLNYRALKKIRKEKKITGQQLADFLGKARITVSSWERGIYQPGEADIRLMAQFLQIPVSNISDLQEIQMNDKGISEDRGGDDKLDIDFNSLTPELAQKIRALHENCIDMRAVNAKLRYLIFRATILLQNLPIMIYIKDKNLKYTYVNDPFLSLIGYSYSFVTIHGVSSLDLFGYKEYSPILELEQQVIKTKQRISNYQIHIPGSFRKRIGLLTIIPILNKDKCIERVIGSIEDITDYCAEEERRKDLEIVISKINHMIWIGETQNANEHSFRYTFISDNISDIYGISKQEAFQDTRIWLNIVHKDDLEAVDRWLESDIFPKKTTYRINNPKKGVRWISSEVFKEGGNKFYGVIADITEEKAKA